MPDNDTGDQLELIPDPSQQSSTAQAQQPKSTTDNRLRNDMIEIKKFLEELLVRMT